MDRGGNGIRYKRAHITLWGKSTFCKRKAFRCRAQRVCNQNLSLATKYQQKKKKKYSSDKWRNMICKLCLRSIFVKRKRIQY